MTSEHTLGLRYLTLKVREPKDQALLSEAFRCWQTVWSETLHELDGVTRLPSDNFSRQDEVGALFRGGVCLGLSCYRWVDLSLPVHRADSYFEVWSNAAVGQLVKYGTRVCIGSQISVPREYRGRDRGVSVKDLLLSMAVRRFLASDADVMTGVMRNDRSMNVLGYRLGGQPLVEGTELHGVKVDLLAFYRQTIAPAWTPLESSVWETSERMRRNENRAA